MHIVKHWVGEAIYENFFGGKPKGDGRGNAKVIDKMLFFHLHFFTISYHLKLTLLLGSLV